MESDLTFFMKQVSEIVNTIFNTSPPGSCK